MDLEFGSEFLLWLCLWTNDNLSVRKKEKKQGWFLRLQSTKISNVVLFWNGAKWWNAKMVHHHALGFWLFYVVFAICCSPSQSQQPHIYPITTSWTFRISLRYPQCHHLVFTMIQPTFFFTMIYQYLSFGICSNSFSQFLHIFTMSQPTS